jgi:hypothetical protein
MDSPVRVSVSGVSVEPAAFSQKVAARYLGVNARWLDDAPIPKCDLRKSGATKPVWRWRRQDLDAFLEARLVLPGHPSSFGE